MQDDIAVEHVRRLALMVELCTIARDIALKELERGDEPDMLSVFQEALTACLERESCNKDDLANVWAMLQLGSRAIRRVSLATDHYNFGPPPTHR